MAETVDGTWWRAVLGEYPTGVALITSLDPEGSPIGMVVGSLAAVSQDPPLIGFFPDATSSTFPMIAASGRFVVSVLGRNHEDLCRSFVRKAEDRFEGARFVNSPQGLPRVADAITWFDATLESRHSYGDHDFVVGRVSAFGVGDADAGLPLLFRRGGYGSFAVPAEEFDSGTLARRLRFADAISGVVADLARELGQEIAVSTVVRDSVIVLSSYPTAGGEPGHGHVGVSFPFAAPVAPVFVAWADDERRSAWIEGSRHLLGAVDRPGLAAVLDAARRRGYGVSGNGDLSDSRFAPNSASPEGSRATYAAVWADMATHMALTNDIEDLSPDDISAIQAPVFGPTGDVELALATSGFSELADAAEVARAIRIVLDASARASALIGGKPVDTMADTR